MASWAMGAYVNLLGEQLGTYLSSGVSEAATGPDQGRWVIARGNAGPLRADGGVPEEFIGRWLYVSSGSAAGQQRRVVHAEPALAALAVDQPFSVTLSALDAFQATWPLPTFSRRGVPGLFEVAKQALRDLWFPDRIEVTTVANQREYSLSTYAAWLTSERQVERFTDGALAGRFAIYDPPNAANAPRPRSTIRWRWILDGGTPFLVADDLAYDVDDFRFQVDVRRPAWSLVTGVESTGPTALTDTLQADLTDVVTVGLLHAYRWLSGWSELPIEERKRYADLVPAQEARARALEHFDPHAGTLSEAA